MLQDDANYYERRAAEEKAAADRATHACAVKAHAEMAQQYAAMAADQSRQSEMR